jgi:hypothetical protein
VIVSGAELPVLELDLMAPTAVEIVMKKVLERELRSV